MEGVAIRVKCRETQGDTESVEDESNYEFRSREKTVVANRLCETSIEKTGEIPSQQHILLWINLYFSAVLWRNEAAVFLEDRDRHPVELLGVEE